MRRPVRAAVVVAAVLVACGGDQNGSGETRDGRLEITARILGYEEGGGRSGLTGLRLCAYGTVQGGRCVDVPLPDGPLVAAVNVPPGDGIEIQVRLFGEGGDAVWCGLTREVRAFSGETTRASVIVSRCESLTALPCAEDLEAPSCGLHRPRAFPSITHLPGGRVLIAGGFGRVGESCDPGCAQPAETEGAFVDEAGELCIPRCRILEAEPTAEVYDSNEGRITHLVALRRPRALHTATLTTDGRHVVIAGGAATARLYMDGDAPMLLPDTFPLDAMGRATAEILHAVALDIQAEVTLSGPRASHVAVDDGQGGVRIAGGLTVEGGSVRMIGDVGVSLPAVEWVEPAGAAPVSVTSLALRKGHAAVRQGEKVVFVGGNDVDRNAPGPFAEIHDLSTGTVTPWGDSETAEARARGYAPNWLTLDVLPDGRLLALGGLYEALFADPEGRVVAPLQPVAHGLLLDPGNTDEEPTLVPLIARRAAHTATVLEDGAVLISGGLTFADTLRPTRTIERLDVEALESSALQGLDGRPLQMAGPRFGHVSLRLADGTVLRAGGLGTLDPERMDEPGRCAVLACDVEIFNPMSRLMDPAP